MLALRLISVSHVGFRGSDQDMETVCLPELNVCGWDGGKAVSLPVLSEKLTISASDEVTIRQEEFTADICVVSEHLGKLH